MNPNHQQPLYPRGFITPGGRAISVRTMANALRELHKMRPEQSVYGWNWCDTPAWMVLKEVRRGINDRINRRAGADQGRNQE